MPTKQATQPEDKPAAQSAEWRADLARLLWRHTCRFALPRNIMRYGFGILALLFFLVQAISGVLLMLYYVPSSQPECSAEGRPLVLAELRADYTDTAGRYRYAKGAKIVVPWDVATGQVHTPQPGLPELLRFPYRSEEHRPPYLAAAWYSVEHTIGKQVPFGGLIRSLHSHGANLFILCLCLHILTLLLRRAYRAERRGQWMALCAILGLALLAAFSGQLLPWNVRAYFATEIGLTTIENALPLFGEILAGLLRGGESVQAGTLQRMFTLHTIVLPLAMLLLFAYCGFAIVQRGASRSAESPADIFRFQPALIALCGGLLLLAANAVWNTAEVFALCGGLLLLLGLVNILVEGPFREPELPRDARNVAMLPGGIMRILTVVVVGFLVALTAAVLAPVQPQGVHATPMDTGLPLHTPSGIEPDWYFQPGYRILTWLPAPLGAVLLFAFALVLFTWPFIDRIFTKLKR